MQVFVLLSLTNTSQTGQIPVVQVPDIKAGNLGQKAHLVCVHRVNPVFWLYVNKLKKTNRSKVHVGLKRTNSKRPFMLSQHIHYLVQTYFHNADKIGHSALQACWGRDKMWLRTQKPMNRFPQEGREGGVACSTKCADSLGSMTRNLWATIFGTNAGKLQNPTAHSLCTL